ncbi:hypothetical protein N0V87_007643 [Didymella glomerata]|uniref:DUF7923 domain-containing protein n=1 Tax=Didymella glomerata TaxID=749621 RepID=A0A9W8WUD7_9PLEO|nr:hypothetical protein N0V87_007643 [Didymella glomerata]
MSKPQALSETLETLKVDWTKCRAYEEQKNALVEDLFEYIETLASKLREAEDELRDKKDVVKLTRSRVEEAEKHVQECQNEKARHSFVLVLIDGNSMLFRDEFIEEGFNGGKRVAALLLKTVREELASRDPFTAHQVQVVARIFADVQRLATTYGETGLIPHTAAFAEFVRGFNVGDAMCDYLDVGSEKGRSDEKIQVVMRQAVKPEDHLKEEPETHW